MVKVSLQSTGRKRKSFKRRFGKKTKALSSPSRTWLTTKTFFSPLPSRFQVALRASNGETFLGGLGNQYAYSFQRMYLPRFDTPAGVPNSWAGGFLSLMELYSKATVKKIVATTRFEQLHDTQFSPLEIVTAIVPWGQQANYNGQPLAFDRLKSCPFSHVHDMGLQSGSRSVVTDKHIIDVQTFLNQPLTNAEAVIKDNGLVLSLPGLEAQAAAPSMAIVFRSANQVAGVETVAVRANYDWVFHVEFSDLRDLPVRPDENCLNWAFADRP